MKIATIRSRVHPKVESLIITDVGFYELKVEMSMSEMADSGDPAGFFKKTIAEHLAVCVRETKLPLNEGLWSVEFTPWVQTNFNMPKGFIA